MRNLRREASKWLANSLNSLPAERELNVEAICDCLERAAGSTFWDWEDGSRLFFWRWGEWWKSARDGEPFYHEKPPPEWWGRNTPAPSWEAELKLREKEDKLLFRRYLESGYISCIVNRFAVLKAETEILG